jgi:hypothetical protein
MAAGSTITVSFPASTTYRITADELTGVTALDRTSAATGRTWTFSSGATRTTAAAVSLTGGRKSACGR